MSDAFSGFRLPWIFANIAKSIGWFMYAKNLDHLILVKKVLLGDRQRWSSAQ